MEKRIVGLVETFDGSGGFLAHGFLIVRPTDRMKLLEAIGSQLQSLYTYIEIDQYLQAAQVEGLKVVLHGNTGSKRVYAKEVLSSVTNDALLRIADDLDLDLTPFRNAVSANRNLEPPGPWRGDNRFKLFISHVSKDKVRAARLKDACAVFGIAGFVAHEEIEPTKSWQDEIFKGLRTMDALVAVLSDGFKGSVFCQQEVGFALGRGTKIITIRVDEDPPGFLSVEQAVLPTGKSVTQIADLIAKLLLDDDRTKVRFKEALASVLPQRPDGEAPMSPLDDEQAVAAMAHARFVQRLSNPIRPATS